jgi:hypothetical protein
MSKNFSVVAHSAEKLLALLPTMAIIFPCCGQQRGKMIGVVANTAEKLSALLPTMRKIFKFEYLHEFETMCEFTLEFQSGA